MERKANPWPPPSKTELVLLCIGVAVIVVLILLSCAGGAPELYVEATAMDRDGLTLDGYRLVGTDGPEYGATVGMTFPLGPRVVQIASFPVPAAIAAGGLPTAGPEQVDAVQEDARAWGEWFASLPWTHAIVVGVLLALVIWQRRPIAKVLGSIRRKVGGGGGSGSS